MNDEQREFIVEKIESYNDELSKAKKQQTLMTVALGCSSIAVLLLANSIDIYDYSNIDVFANVPLLSAFMGYAVYSGKRLIENIATKTGLQNSVRDLENQLQIDKLASGNGMGR